MADMLLPSSSEEDSEEDGSSTDDAAGEEAHTRGRQRSKKRRRSEEGSSAERSSRRRRGSKGSKEGRRRHKDKGREKEKRRRRQQRENEREQQVGGLLQRAVPTICLATSCMAGWVHLQPGWPFVCLVLNGGEHITPTRCHPAHDPAGKGNSEVGVIWGSLRLADAICIRRRASTKLKALFREESSTLPQRSAPCMGPSLSLQVRLERQTGAGQRAPQVKAWAGTPAGASQEPYYYDTR